ncbi:hypothetical protein [Brevibacterium yomogidense]|uniref:hypothetical protein n=1 Tax=Brevibacterium yomogidense TaxID=946573 RepID=UPI0018DF6ABD|nr:hypothetical protein [Brevibacterium yomogidense]
MDDMNRPREDNGPRAADPQHLDPQEADAQKAAAQRAEAREAEDTDLETEVEVADEWGKESFPASDPPANH